MKTFATEAEFRQAVMEGVDGIGTQLTQHKTAVATLLEDHKRLDADTKKSFDDLRKAMNDSTLAAAALSKINAQLRQEAVSAGMDPLQKLISDPRKRGIINLVSRQLMNDDGAYNQQITAIGKAIGEDTSPGSTLIIAQLFKEIYDTLAEYGAWSKLGVRRVGTKVTNFPVKTARVTAGWLTTEASPIPDSTSEAGGTIILTVLPNAVLLNVSKQLIEDAEFDVSQIVMTDFQEAWNLGLDTAAFVGTGAGGAVDGNFTGLFNGATAVSAAQGNTTVEAMSYNDFLKVLESVAPIVLTRKPRWFMHPQMLARALAIRDNNGRPIFLGALDAPSYGAIGTILGRSPHSAMSTLRSSPSAMTSCSNPAITIAGTPWSGPSVPTAAPQPQPAWPTAPPPSAPPRTNPSGQ